MRKLSFLLAALAMVLGLSQCRKPAMSSYSGPVGDRVFQHVTVSTGYGDNNSKLDLSNVAGQLKLTWTENDVMKVYEGGENVSGDGLKIVGPISEDGLSATFEGDILAGDGELTFRVGKKPTVEEKSFESQDGTLDYIKNKLLCVENTKKICFNPEGKYDNISMGLPYALLKLDLSYFATPAKDGDVTVEIRKEKENKEQNNPIASVKCASDKLKEVYVAIPADFVPEGGNPKEETYVFSAPDSGLDDVEIPFPIGANSFYTSDDGSGQGSGDPIVIKPEQPTPQHEAVNMGLPAPYDKLEWSKYNLGVDPEDLDAAADWYGDYYAWGATETWYSAGGQTSSPTWKEGYSDGYSRANCPFTNGTYSNSNKKAFTKYIPTGKTDYWAGDGDPDNKLVLESSDDAATQAWGGGWRMPTTEEWKALYDNNTFEWLAADVESAKVSGFKAVAAGYLVIKGKDSSLDPTVYLFLPAAGCRYDASLLDAGSNGYYWSSSLYSSSPRSAYYMFISGNVSPQSYNYRYYGFTVRPVR
ncbi:MAG: hypothetical protein MJZ78_05205 [Bacteroidales bacterium]|nr:hypothetical protein [Bacteroidales bacterium]